MSVNDQRTINSNLTAFFILTFAFTWFFWLFGVLSSLGILLYLVAALGLIVRERQFWFTKLSRPERIF